MSSAIRDAALYLHHCRKTGAGDAKRRREEERETERIRAERERWPELSPGERREQENADFPIRFEIVLLPKGAKEKERETALQSLKAQTYGQYRIGPCEGEPEDGDRLVFMEEDGWLHPAALYEIAKTISETGAEFLYTDEDYFQDRPKGLNQPRYQSGYGPDTMRGCDLTGAFLACSRGGTLRRDDRGRTVGRGGPDGLQGEAG